MILPPRKIENLIFLLMVTLVRQILFSSLPDRISLLHILFEPTSYQRVKLIDRYYFSTFKSDRIFINLAKISDFKAPSSRRQRAFEWIIWVGGQTRILRRWQRFWAFVNNDPCRLSLVSLYPVIKLCVKYFITHSNNKLMYKLIDKYRFWTTT